VKFRSIRHIVDLSTEETPAPSLSDTIEALGRTLDRKWDEEDLPYIISKSCIF